MLPSQTLTRSLSTAVGAAAAAALLATAATAQTAPPQRDAAALARDEAAIKAARIAQTQAMAVDHGRDGIRVNCICPGPMYTPMVYARGMSDAARAQRAGATEFFNMVLVEGIAAPV